METEPTPMAELRRGTRLSFDHLQKPTLGTQHPTDDMNAAACSPQSSSA